MINSELRTIYSTLNITDTDVVYVISLQVDMKLEKNLKDSQETGTKEVQTSATVTATYSVSRRTEQLQFKYWRSEIKT